MFKSTQIETPLGLLCAVADEQALIQLEFDSECTVPKGNLPPLISIKKELESYFAKKLTQFKTPLRLHGTPFQVQVWEELQRISYGQTRSYVAIAKQLGHPKAYRAVGNANGCNCLAIIVPCHRVISADGSLGGYGSGLHRKEWLLKHES